MAFDPNAAYRLYATAGGWDSGDAYLFEQGGLYYRRFSPYTQVTPDTNPVPTSQVSYDPATGELLAGGVPIDVGGGDTRETLVLANWTAQAQKAASRKAIPCVLDRMAGAAMGAWGFYRHKSDYVGSCCRVRRDSDDVEMDIPFGADNIVDTSLMISFQGSSVLYLTKFYDQIGANDITQVTEASQPLVDGLDYLRNGAPFFRANPGNGLGYFTIPAGISITDRNNCSVWTIAGFNTNRLANYIWDLGASAGTFAQNCTPTSAFSAQIKVDGTNVSWGTMATIPPSNTGVLGMNSAVGGATWYHGSSSTAHAAFGSLGLVGGRWPTDVASGSAGLFYSLIIFNAALTAADVILIQYGLAEVCSGKVNYDANVVLQGDSITAGTAGYAVNYKRVMMNYMPPNISVYNQGLGGQTMATEVTEATNYVDGVYKSGKPNIAIMLGGVNDIHGATSGAALFALLETWATARRAAGYLAVAAVIYNYIVTGSHTQIEQDELEIYNGLLRDYYDAGGIDGLIDWTLDEDLDPMDSTDSPDNLHPAEPGYKKAVPIMMGEIGRLLPSI